jgi:hypothetical protein
LNTGDSIPEIPDSLMAACKRGELIVFVGAGVSRLLGAPSWAGLADKALDELHRNGGLSFSEKTQLTSLDARKKLSIAEIIAGRTGFNLDYERLLNVKAESQSTICSDIVSIGAPIVTTNYDDWLDIELSKKIQKNSDLDDSHTRPMDTRPPIFCDRIDLTIDKLFNSDTIIHLHGGMKNRKSMIVTSAEYFEHYSSDMVKEFLKTLFGRFVVLFIGYGLEEAEILEFIFSKAKQDKTQAGYWLYPCYSFDNAVTNHIKE